MAMEAIATEGIREWLGGLLSFFTSKPKGEDADSKKKAEPINVIQEKNRNGDAIIKYINATYLNDEWLDGCTETNIDISLDGQLAVLSINTKKPSDLVKAIDDYLRAIEKLIRESKSERVKFYQEARKVLKDLESHPTAAKLEETVKKFKAMVYPLDKWIPKAPNYKTHVGGLEMVVDSSKPFYDWNHYTFTIRSDAHALLPSLSKAQVKEVGQVMIELVTNIFRGQYGMFDELAEGMVFDDIDYDKLYDAEGVNEDTLDTMYDIEAMLGDRRDINWKAITVPYVTSFEKMLVALDILIQRSLKRA